MTRELYLDVGQRYFIGGEVIVEELESTKSGTNAAKDSGCRTIEQRGKAGSRTRPAFERQDTSHACFFKDPEGD